MPPRVRAERPTSRGFLRRQGLDRPADKGHGQHRATRPRPMTNRVKSAAPASRLKSRTALALHTWGPRARASPVTRYLEKIAVDLFLPCVRIAYMQRDRQTILKQLIETVTFVQEDISGNDPSEVDETTVPIKSLVGFDSLRGVETTLLLSEFLKMELKPKKGEALNLFVSTDGRRALSLSETADRILALVN